MTSGELPETSKPLTLSFDTWHRLEAKSEEGGRLGTVESSADGKRWKPLTKPFAGNSDGWKRVPGHRSRKRNTFVSATGT